MRSQRAFAAFARCCCCGAAEAPPAPSKHAAPDQAQLQTKLSHEDRLGALQHAAVLTRQLHTCPRLIRHSYHTMTGSAPCTRRPTCDASSATLPAPDQAQASHNDRLGALHQPAVLRRQEHHVQQAPVRGAHARRR